MRQHSKELKCTGASANEYMQAEANNNVERSSAEQEQPIVEQVKFNSCKAKDVRVTLKFPIASDSKAESEFIGRLKEIYLKKIEAKAMQMEESALESSPTDKSVNLNNTKEDKRHE